MWETVINPVSSDNFLRVSATDPSKALTEDPFLMMVEEAGKDAEKRRVFDEGVYAICHDFTQYWRKGGVNGEVGQEEARL